MKGRRLNSKSSRARRDCRQRALPPSNPVATRSSFQIQALMQASRGRPAPPLSNEGLRKAHSGYWRLTSLIAVLRSNSRGGKVQTLVEGQAIKHEQYGTGVVTESNNERTTIDFDNHGVKKFVTSIWTAELIGEPPAQPPARRRGRRKSKKVAA